MPYTGTKKLGTLSSNGKPILTYDVRLLKPGWTGVYGKVCTIHGKLYVGSGAGREGICSRRDGHDKNLREGTHRNPHLSAAWAKYGEAAFVFVVLEYCPKDQCLLREQYWMDHYDAADRRYGYNSCPTAGSMLGYEHREDSKQQMSQSAKERMEDPEIRRSLSEHGKKQFESQDARDQRAASQSELWKDPEYRARQVAARVGKKQSPESIAKRSASTKGKKRSPEFCARISESRKMQKASQETKKAMSDAAKKRWNGPDAEENRKKISEATKAGMAAMTDEDKQRMSEAARNRVVSEETRQKLSEAATQQWARVHTKRLSQRLAVTRPTSNVGDTSVAS